MCTLAVLRTRSKRLNRSATTTTVIVANGDDSDDNVANDNKTNSLNTDVTSNSVQPNKETENHLHQQSSSQWSELITIILLRDDYYCCSCAAVTPKQLFLFFTMSLSCSRSTGVAIYRALKTLELCF